MSYNVLAKPAGAICNLDCKYCFYLDRENLYPDSKFRMSDEVLEDYVRQYLTTQRVREINLAWQGGEPTLMGLDFFRKSVEYARKHQKPGTVVQHALQTNGTLLDDDWCRFLKEAGYLVGLSIDGPQDVHDAYRVDKAGRPTWERVMRALELLKKHEVEYNLLVTVHSANAPHPREVYAFLREHGRFLQFIPIVERLPDQTVSERSVTAEQWGAFLVGVFDEWIGRDVGQIFVQMFDAALASWAGSPPSLCLFAETCGDALAVEHNGDVYSCDHFVDPLHRLGNLREKPLLELVMSPEQRRFGADKRDTLPAYCRRCEVRFACHGECPKNRFISSPDGEPGLNYLCAGYKRFFKHIDRPMRVMTALLQRRMPPAAIMQMLDQL